MDRDQDGTSEAWSIRRGSMGSTCFALAWLRCGGVPGWSCSRAKLVQDLTGGFGICLVIREVLVEGNGPDKYLDGHWHVVVSFCNKTLFIL